MCPQHVIGHGQLFPQNSECSAVAWYINTQFNCRQGKFQHNEVKVKKSLQCEPPVNLVLMLAVQNVPIYYNLWDTTSWRGDFELHAEIECSRVSMNEMGMVVVIELHCGHGVGSASLNALWFTYVFTVQCIIRLGIKDRGVTGVGNLRHHAIVWSRSTVPEVWDASVRGVWELLGG
ncbi:hypothetical protein BDQ17DRAFT_1409030 [Cyathus striatus]|nr:hypothetical protein BDQ17DRAFT_1409030 [Cyathus striatus]